jgi:hypothetical protein
MPEIITIYSDDGFVRWKPAGAAGKGRGGGDANWIDGPACPIHGPWLVVARKDGTGYFYSCKVAKGEDWCKNKAGRPWTDENPPGPSDDDLYDSDEDLFG